MKKYLTRQSHGIRITSEVMFKGTPSEHIEESYELDDKDDPGSTINGAAWKLDVGAECNRLLNMADELRPKGFYANDVAALESIVARVAAFEELETERPQTIEKPRGTRR